MNKFGKCLEYNFFSPSANSTIFAIFWKHLPIFRYQKIEKETLLGS
jgi:hypothetical protein